eukprot:6868-Heterococcus_DN1.PRE.3
MGSAFSQDTQGSHAGAAHQQPNHDDDNERHRVDGNGAASLLSFSAWGFVLLGQKLFPAAADKQAPTVDIRIR